MNPFYHDLSDVDLCFSRVLYTTSIVYWARVVIDRVPSRISKPVAGSEGHQTAGMDRSDQGFHTFAISPPLPTQPLIFWLPQISFLVPSPSCQYFHPWFPEQLLCATNHWLEPTPPPSRCHFSGRQTVAICVIGTWALPISQPHLLRHPR